MPKKIKKHDPIERAISAILRHVGENAKRPGLKETPARVARAWREWLRGYRKPTFKTTTFPSRYTGIVARPNVPFQSFCEHHMARYSGVVHFAYIPRGHVLGLSKISRTIQWLAARLTIQEQLTDEVVNYFQKLLDTYEIAVVIVARHSCESTRGAKVDAPTVTARLTGRFFSDPRTREEFYELIKL